MFRDDWTSSFVIMGIIVALVAIGLWEAAIWIIGHISIGWR
jgi:hypothetical protein